VVHNSGTKGGNAPRREKKKSLNPRRGEKSDSLTKCCGLGETSLRDGSRGVKGNQQENLFGVVLREGKKGFVLSEGRGKKG